MNIIEWSTLTEAQRSRELARPALAATRQQAKRVAEIIAEVRRDGDGALFRLTQSFDGIALDALEVEAREFDAAAKALTEEQKGAIAAAAANIETFHSLQRPNAIDIETQPGVRCERVVRPLGRVGLYVPAGTAPLPSTALMLGVPARLAGCPLRILCCPPTRDGSVDAAVLYTARLTSVSRVFKIGGAQAIAAMAYGTATIPKVDKIFGPGNAWVTEAKTQVDLDPGGAAKDYPAGPSEVLVIADEGANADFVAADLLSQAEHGADSQAILITTHRPLADAVIAAIHRQLRSLSRREIVEQSLAHAALIVADDMAEAIAIANRYAPEHLILQVADARRWLDQVESAGSVFLGPWTPESVGDYCSGTNHVLPTYGYASRYSSLGLNDFLRTMTVQELTPAGLQTIGPVATTLAETEGLDAHARAVTLRLEAIASESGR
ncbi:MAG TPA: histidinol dehydrogenase [Gammaproteobacteria bacterium]|nr:histidinol dehydrogenase [Gammaproteobacteria bacterium]